QALPVRVRQRPDTGRAAGRVRPRYRAGVAAARPRRPLSGREGRLQAGARAAALHRRREGSPHAGFAQPHELRAVQEEDVVPRRVQGVPRSRTLLDNWRRGMAGGGGLRTRLGAAGHGYGRRGSARHAGHRQSLPERRLRARDQPHGTMSARVGAEETEMNGVYDGLTVVELADRRNQWAGKLLADGGARVIQIEPPAGGPGRWCGPFVDDTVDPDRCLDYWWYNTGKQSVAVDIGRQPAQDLLRRLLARADIFLESAAPGMLAAYGLDYASVSENRGLIYASLTDFGQDGPWRDL